jgi:hypothetical protein
VVHISRHDGAWRREAIWDVPAGTAFPPGGFVPDTPAASACVGPDGALHVVLVDFVKGEVRHCRREGDAWVSEPVVAAKHVVSTGVSFSGGSLAIAVCDAEARQVLLALADRAAQARCGP